MAGSAPGFIGVYVAGLLQQYCGGWPAVFTSTAVNCLIGAFFYLVFASGKTIVGV